MARCLTQKNFRGATGAPKASTRRFARISKYFGGCVSAKFAANAQGTSAVEFALLAPVMLTFFVGVIVLSVVLSTYSALQEIASEAARAALPGLTTNQQAQYANSYITSALSNYSFLDPAQLTVTINATQNTFQVTLSYNASTSYFTVLASSIVSTPIIITRGATIQLSNF